MGCLPSGSHRRRGCRGCDRACHRRARGPRLVVAVPGASPRRGSIPFLLLCSPGSLRSARRRPFSYRQRGATSVGAVPLPVVHVPPDLTVVVAELLAQPLMS